MENHGIITLKVKLGNNDGIEADKAMYHEVLEYSKKYPISVRVDANGGWSLEEAKHMMAWLAERGCEYVEKPLKEGKEGDLPELFKHRHIPIFNDESIAAGAAVSGVLDHIDLDSHFNLNPDPCEGAPLINEVIVPTESPGHGGHFTNPL